MIFLKEKSATMDSKDLIRIGVAKKMKKLITEHLNKNRTIVSEDSTFLLKILQNIMMP